AEADESDRSFLVYRPHVGIVTNIEADHLNTYGDLAGLEDAFLDFCGRGEPPAERDRHVVARGALPGRPRRAAAGRVHAAHARPAHGPQLVRRRPDRAEAGHPDRLDRRGAGVLPGGPAPVRT